MMAAVAAAPAWCRSMSRATPGRCTTADRSWAAMSGGASSGPAAPTGRATPAVAPAICISAPVVPRPLPASIVPTIFATAVDVTAVGSDNDASRSPQDDVSRICLCGDGHQSHREETERRHNTPSATGAKLCSHNNQPSFLRKRSSAYRILTAADHAAKGIPINPRGPVNSTAQHLQRRTACQRGERRQNIKKSLTGV